MKKFWIAAGMLGMTVGSFGAFAQDATVGERPSTQMGSMMGGNAPSMKDERQSAGIPDQMKAKHLARMRSHLEAVRDIIDAMERGEFGEASKTARTELAMGPGMGGKGKGMGMRRGKGMCKGMTNEDFKALGMGFHKSAGKLADTLDQGDMKTSLKALSNTMNYCIQCHATFRQ